MNHLRSPRLAEFLRYHRKAGELYYRLVPRHVLGGRPRREGPRILLWLLYRLGDVVLASTVIGAVRREHPEARITFATRWEYADLLRHDPRLDEVVCCRDLAAIGRLVDRGRFDRTACLHIVDRSNVEEFREFVDDADERAARGDWWEHGHLVDHYVELTRDRLGIEIVDRKSPLHLPEADRRFVREDLGRRGIGDETPLVVFHTVTERLKSWPLDRFRRLADAVRSRWPDHRVVVVGSKGEPPLASEGVIDLHGRYSLTRLAALLSRSNAFVGGVSGPMHMADSLEVPSVVLYGSEIPEWGGPYQALAESIQSPSTCEPACCWPCDQPAFCIDDIAVESVVSALGRLLEGGNG